MPASHRIDQFGGAPQHGDARSQPPTRRAGSTRLTGRIGRLG